MKRRIRGFLIAGVIVGSVALHHPASGASIEAQKPSTRTSDVSVRREHHRMAHYVYHPYYPYYFGRPYYYSPGPFFLPVPPSWGDGWQWW